MEDREWMYTLRRDEHDYDLLFIVKVEEFLQQIGRASSRERVFTAV